MPKVDAAVLMAPSEQWPAKPDQLLPGWNSNKGVAEEMMTRRCRRPVAAEAIRAPETQQARCRRDGRGEMRSIIFFGAAEAGTEKRFDSPPGRGRPVRTDPESVVKRNN